MLLNISEVVFIARKQITRPRVPFAISGTDYNKTLKITQEKKVNEEEAKIKEDTFY